MTAAASLRFGEVTIEQYTLPAGVSVVKATDARDGRFLRLVFPVDSAVLVRSSPSDQAMVERTDIAWLTNWNTYSLYVPAPCSVICVLVPARILDESADSSRELPVLAATNLWLRNPVREFVRTITADEGPRERLSQYLVEKLILEMTLSLLLEAQGARKISAQAERSLYARAMAYIAAYKSDSELTPAKVASSMNISLRQLQRAFAAENSSITEEIRRHRVETATRLLSDAAYRHLDLTQIAQHAGFGSPAEMRRAIAAVHGCTPSQLRVSA